MTKPKEQIYALRANATWGIDVQYPWQRRAGVATITNESDGLLTHNHHRSAARCHVAVRLALLDQI